MPVRLLHHLTGMACGCPLGTLASAGAGFLSSQAPHPFSPPARLYQRKRQGTRLPRRKKANETSWAANFPLIAITACKRDPSRFHGGHCLVASAAVESSTSDGEKKRALATASPQPDAIAPARHLPAGGTVLPQACPAARDQWRPSAGVKSSTPDPGTSAEFAG